MAKYQVLSNLTHNLTTYPPGSEIELDPSDKNTQELSELKVIKRDPNFKASAESTPTEKFGSASSPAEIEKAANRAALDPHPKGFCNKCKANREIVNAQISVDDATKAVTTVGNCVVCGGVINKTKGKPRKDKKKKEAPKEEKKENE